MRKSVIDPPFSHPFTFTSAWMVSRGSKVRKFGDPGKCSTCILPVHGTPVSGGIAHKPPLYHQSEHWFMKRHEGLTSTCNQQTIIGMLTAQNLSTSIIINLPGVWMMIYDTSDRRKRPFFILDLSHKTSHEGSEGTVITVEVPIVP